ncbi:MAG: hypothetical protein M1820_008513 [Bogoriella megaspora]|nr:MAG: hypothetical protein M1820_008513 [Bogoriella megaspora]
MATKSRAEAEKEVSSWGFNHVFTWTDGPNAYYPPHSHRGLTTHLILRGSLTITYPKDEKPTKETFGVGARVDVDAGRSHEVWMVIAINALSRVNLSSLPSVAVQRYYKHVFHNISADFFFTTDAGPSGKSFSV